MANEPQRDIKSVDNKHDSEMRYLDGMHSEWMKNKTHTQASTRLTCTVMLVIRSVWNRNAKSCSEIYEIGIKKCLAGGCDAVK